MKNTFTSNVVTTTAVAVAACIGLTSCQSFAPKTAQMIPEGQRVFYCSHSLMWDTPAPVAELATAYGITNHVLVGLERMGFSTTLQHWQQPDARNQSKQALLTGKVDDFIMSPMEIPDEGIDNFVKLGLLNNPNMRFLVQNNWTAFNQDGQKQHQGLAVMNQVNWDATTVETLNGLDTTYEKAFEVQVNQINKEVGHTVLYIIPTSQAETALRIKVAQNGFPGLDKQSQLFIDKIGHPAAPLIALNAYVHFAVLYGRSPVGLPMPSVLKRALAKYPKFDDASNKALQELAWNTVINYSQYDCVKVPAAKKP
jgi:hypothetical protein